MKEFQKTGKQIEKSCYRPDLLIKCSHRDSSCSCSKKRHFRRFRPTEYQKPRRQMRMRRKRKHFFRPKSRRTSKGTRCFLCNKSGHYAKNCPSKEKSKSVRKTFNQILQLNPELEDHDVESLYSETDEQTPGTAFIINRFSDGSESDTDSESYSESEYSDVSIESQPFFTIQSISIVQSVPMAAPLRKQIR